VIDFNLKVNDRIEIVANEKAYKSLILDVEDEFLRINVPVYDGDYLVLHTGEEIEINSYLDESRCYNFFCTVLSRGKEGNIIYYRLSTPFNVAKIQRRNFFRVELVQEIQFKKITNIDEDDIDSIPYQKGLMVDVSAGGLRLKTKEDLRKGDIILVDLKLPKIEFELRCEFVRSVIADDKEKLCGLRFVDIMPTQVEIIIKELFQIVRKQRSNV
jgi:c-di-GMP-binding flagellar brake protein YcgR